MFDLNIDKRKREQLLRLRILRYRQTPNNPKRVKAHAIRREPSRLYSWLFSVNFADFQNTRFSGRFNVYVCFLFFSAHRHLQF